jgi:hypothetical protein
LEVSESSTSLTGESRSDATDSDRSVLANDPTFTSLLQSQYRAPSITAGQTPFLGRAAGAAANTLPIVAPITGVSCTRTSQSFIQRFSH